MVVMHFYAWSCAGGCDSVNYFMSSSLCNAYVVVVDVGFRVLLQDCTTCCSTCVPTCNLEESLNGPVTCHMTREALEEPGVEQRA